MRPIVRTECYGKPFPKTLSYDQRPLQLGMGGSPWHVAVASILLCRTRRAQVDRVLENLFTMWPTPGHMAVADDSAIGVVVRPCGLHTTRARQLRRFSQKWGTPEWKELKDLPGVGDYVHDAVGVFCFGLTDIESGDHALVAYLEDCVKEVGLGDMR